MKKLLIFPDITVVRQEPTILVKMKPIINKAQNISSGMYTIFKLRKTEWTRPGDGAYHTARSEDWLLTWVASYNQVEEANAGLKSMITGDKDLASDWRKRKVYSGINEADFYDMYISNPNNFLDRKYFLTTPSYSVEHLQADLKGRLSKNGVNVV